MQSRRRGAVPVSRTRRADKDSREPSRSRSWESVESTVHRSIRWPLPSRSGSWCRRATSWRGPSSAACCGPRILSEQGAVLRNPRDRIPGLARGEARPVAAYRLHPLHSQGGLPRVRRARRAGRQPARCKDRTASSGYQSDASGVQCLRTGESLSWGQSRYRASRAPETPEGGKPRESWNWPRRPMAEKGVMSDKGGNKGGTVDLCSTCGEPSNHHRDQGVPSDSPTHVTA